MKREYDFSKGVRGKFYRGGKPFQIVINVDEPRQHPRFEVYVDTDGKYRFRLANDKHIVFISGDEYESKDDCLNAISELKRDSIVAPTVFA